MNPQKSGCEFGRKLSTRSSQFDRAMQASKQFAPDILLERADVTANRRLRHIQFTSGIGKTEPPCRGLEGAQR
jgi:hypothetical protein